MNAKGFSSVIVMLALGIMTVGQVVPQAREATARAVAAALWALLLAVVCATTTTAFISSITTRIHLG